MNKATQSISVVIPNYNGSELLRKFLDSVAADLDAGDEIIIVDDSSTDKSVEYLVERFSLNQQEVEDSNQVSENFFPHLSNLEYSYYFGTAKLNSKTLQIKVLALAKNVRFAAAVNAGVLLVENNYFLLLNNDVEVLPGCKNALLNVVDPKVFGVGCLEYEENFEGEKSGKNKLWFEKGLFNHSKAMEMTSGTTAWVSGGSGLFSAKKWIALDGFDQLFYPAYWEDIDISFRAQKKGWKVLFEESAVVLHKHESTNLDVYGKKKMYSMSWKNADAFVIKNGTLLQKIMHVLWKPYWKIMRNQYLKNTVEF